MHFGIGHALDLFFGIHFWLTPTHTHIHMCAPEHLSLFSINFHQPKTLLGRYSCGKVVFVRLQTEPNGDDQVGTEDTVCLVQIRRMK